MRRHISNIWVKGTNALAFNILECFVDNLFRVYLNIMLLIISILVFLAETPNIVVSIAAVTSSIQNFVERNQWIQPVRQYCGNNPSCTFENGQCWCCHDRDIRLGDELAHKFHLNTIRMQQSCKAKLIIIFFAYT